MDNKLVYVPMAVDMVHPGHINIIKTAAELGTVMVGLFSDEAIASYKRMPLMNYEQRKCVIENVKGVELVVKQETRDYEPNLRRYQPAYMVHGTDWRTGPLADVREKAIVMMREWGGQVVEPEYTRGISSSALKSGLQDSGVLPQNRQPALARLLATKDFTYICGIPGAFGAVTLAQTELAEVRKPKKIVDVLFLEPLRGMPTDPSRYLAQVNEVASLTTLPMLIGDRSFASKEQLAWGLKEAQRLGVSAVTLSGVSTEAIQEKLAIFREEKLAPDFLAIPEIAYTENEAAQTAARVQLCVDGGASALFLTGLPADGDAQFLKACAAAKLPMIAEAAPDTANGTLRAAGFCAVLGRDLLREPSARSIREAAEAFLRLE